MLMKKLKGFFVWTIISKTKGVNTNLIVYRQLIKQIDRNIDKQIKRQIKLQIEKQIVRYKKRQIVRYKERQIVRYKERQIVRQKDRQIHDVVQSQIEKTWFLTIFPISCQFCQTFSKSNLAANRFNFLVPVSHWFLVDLLPSHWSDSPSCSLIGGDGSGWRIDRVRFYPPARNKKINRIETYKLSPVPILATR